VFNPNLFESGVQIVLDKSGGKAAIRILRQAEVNDGGFKVAVGIVHLKMA